MSNDEPLNEIGVQAIDSGVQNKVSAPTDNVIAQTTTPKTSLMKMVNIKEMPTYLEYSQKNIGQNIVKEDSEGK